MKYRGSQHCIGCALGHDLIEMLEAANAATGNHWNGYRLGDCTREFEIKALPCAVAIHAGEQNLAGAHLGDSGGPLQRIDSRRISAAMGEDLPMSANALGIDGHHNALGPKLIGALANQIWLMNRSGIHTDFVSARIQKPADILDGADTAPNGQRNED